MEVRKKGVEIMVETVYVIVVVPVTVASGYTSI